MYPSTFIFLFTSSSLLLNLLPLTNGNRIVPTKLNKGVINEFIDNAAEKYPTCKLQNLLEIIVNVNREYENNIKYHRNLDKEYTKKET